MEATTDTAAPAPEAGPVRRLERGRNVDHVAELRRLADVSERDAETLSAARLAPPAEVARIQLAALVRIEAQNDQIVALLTEIRDQGRPKAAK